MSAPFDAAAVLDALKTKLEATTGVGAVFVGVPEAPQDQLTATVSLAGATLLRPKTVGTILRRLRYRVEFGYRVAGQEEEAERGVAAALDDFLIRLYADLTLGGACNSAVDIDLSQADAPEYQTRAGLEERLYPVIVSADQVTPYSATTSQ
jgi:hypothetical protein